jgi:hypothetical protein
MQGTNSILETSTRELKDKLFEVNRQYTNLNTRYTDLERTKEEEIGVLRQKEADNLKEI